MNTDSLRCRCHTLRRIIGDAIKDGLRPRGIPEATGISVHLSWHRALFHLDADDFESAPAVYDAQIANRRASAMSELADASALLWRLQLLNVRGVNAGSYWLTAGRRKR